MVTRILKVVAVVIGLGALVVIACSLVKMSGTLERIEWSLESTHDLLSEERNENARFRQSANMSMDEMMQGVTFLKIVMLRPKIDIRLAKSIARYVNKYAVEEGFDPDLALAIIYVESRFNPEALSRSKAEGLMQIMPFWKEQLDIKTSLRDPETSIKYGLKILKMYERMYRGNLKLALTAYNRGPVNVDYDLRNGASPFNEYPTDVVEAWSKIKMTVASRM